MTLKEILEKRGRIVDQMREMLDKAEAENRDLNAEEQQSYSAMENEQTDLGNRAKRMQEQESLEKTLNEILPAQNNRSLGSDSNANPYAAPEYLAAFNQYVRRELVQDPRILNALSVGAATEGGNIIPEEFDTKLREIMLDLNEFRNLIEVINTGGDRHIPLEGSVGSAAWTAEAAAYNESDPSFNRVSIGAHKLTRIVKVSEELLNDAFFDVMGYLARNFGRSFHVAEEAAIVNGTGTGQPAGMIGGASAGITTASGTAITADELLDLYHALLRPYRKSATWVMNDDTIKAVSKLKDGNGQYLWQPGLVAGQPDTIRGRRVVTSSAMPTIAVNAVTVLFGDLKSYTLADRGSRVMQRLNELYAANGQVGFRMYQRMDGAVVVPEGIKKLTQAAT
ncbi:MAG: phage major capsid protein [Candidatus Thiodiazotropha endolucinida]